MAGWWPRPGTAVIRANGWPSGQRPVKKPSRSMSWSGKSSADSASGERRSAAAVAWSVPGARPMPRSMRPGWSASSMPNCSATTSETWLGSMTPPEPTRSVVVASAMWPISTGGAELAMPGMLWCSATQNRRYPSRSTCWARSTVARSASPAFPPSGTGARSRTESGTCSAPKVRASSTTCPNSASSSVLPAMSRLWRRQRTPHDDPGPAAARVVLGQRHLGEPHPPVERERPLVGGTGEGLQAGRPAFDGDGGERLVQAPGQAQAAGVVPDRDEVDVTVAGGRDEAEQIPDDLAVGYLPGRERGVGELAEEHRVMEMAKHVDVDMPAVAPELVEGAQDLGQVAVPDRLDRDLTHGRASLAPAVALPDLDVAEQRVTGHDHGRGARVRRARGPVVDVPGVGAQRVDASRPALGQDQLDPPGPGDDLDGDLAVSTRGLGEVDRDPPGGGLRGDPSRDDPAPGLLDVGRGGPQDQRFRLEADPRVRDERRLRRQVRHQGLEVGGGLGLVGPAKPVIELRQIDPAFGGRDPQPFGDRLPVRIDRPFRRDLVRLR